MSLLLTRTFQFATNPNPSTVEAAMISMAARSSACSPSRSGIP
jgi:hypothetical protein